MVIRKQIDEEIMLRQFIMYN